MYSPPSFSTTAAPPVAKTTGTGRLLRRVIVALLIVSGLLTLAYSAASLYIATQLVYAPQKAIYATPASLGLQFRDVTFPSRIDHLPLRGWFIPGVLPGGRLTARRTIIVVHGSRANRADQAAGLLDLSGAFARQGFAVLAFDMRGSGESPSAPLSLGYFEQRDVLGAIDFLRTGPLPYPALGRPRIIGGWGVSMGAATLLLAASQEPAIRAVVSDSAYADILPILEREVPRGGHLPPLFTPGALLAAQALYGIDYYDVRPVDVVAGIAPRPIFFIHGAADTYVPPSNLALLASAARTASGASVQTWLVPGANHAQAYHTQTQEYVARVMAFFTGTLGPDSGR
ncbi:MAG TPA: alpha/beta hydrolase [Ktedonobacteraceae bacterium]|nr:alpha/beta hydrolase [Ktedonobacteraceae bacterium]